MTAFPVRRLVQGAPSRAMRAAFAAWEVRPRDGERLPDLLARLAGALTETEVVERRLAELPHKLADLLEIFVSEPGRPRDAAAVLAAREEPFRTRADVEACLAALHREGFLFPLPACDDALYAVPMELAECIRELRRRQRSEVRDAVTLEGFLHARYFHDRHKDPDDGSGDHAAKIYRLYLLDGSIRSRVRRLSKIVRATFDLVVGRYGGIAAWDELAADVPGGAPGMLDLVHKGLEEAMLGTVVDLPLGRFGLKPCRRAVVVFHEIVRAELRRRSEERPPRIERVLEAGVDLVGNVGRFLREVRDRKVQITREGALYKTSARRIAKALLPIAGDPLDGAGQVRLLFGFCTRRRLVDRTGERALRVTPEGLAFEARSLHEKLRALLAHVVEERSGGAAGLHQVRLRRVLLRLLARSAPGEWIETPVLPFVARNAYLAHLEEWAAQGRPGRWGAGSPMSADGPAELSAGLLGFLKRRLYPLGLVDLGLEAGMPVAVRLSQLGQDLLEACGEDEEPGEADLGASRSSVLVNPDFEVIVFPGDDEHEVVHAFDRFAERIKSDRLHHFRITRASIEAARREGTCAADVLAELTERARAPIPQNVVYTIEDWAGARSTGGGR